MNSVNWGLYADLQEKADSSEKIGNRNFLSTPFNHSFPNSLLTEKEVKCEWKKKYDDDDDEPIINAAEASYMRKVLRSHLVTTSYDVEVLQKNPHSPLYSVKSFKELNLHEELLKGVYAMGFNSPSKIQETALPILLAEPPQNVIAQSQSGTGKTAAFVLACLSRIDVTLKYPQVLILSPTLELAEQTGDVAKRMAQFCPNIEFCFAVRGQRQHQVITAQFLIGTPGKVLDWSLHHRPPLFDLEKITIFVLDEADVMISTQGHQDQSIRIRKKLDPNCQMLLFSATYSEDVINFTDLIVPNPVTIRLRREEESLDNIKQYYIDVTKIKNINVSLSGADLYTCQKYAVLQNVYGIINIGQAIIFCRTRKTASWLSQTLISEGHSVSMLSGELTTNERIAVLDGFRKGNTRILITTNVCARGIDVEQVTVVVNFDLPVDLNGEADCETYLHRIGRSGRFGKPGFAINMVDSEKALIVIKQIEDHFGKEILEVIADDIDEKTFD